MAWDEGNQTRRPKEDVNQEILNLEGFLDENEAKQNLYKFLKDNITFTTSLEPLYKAITTMYMYMLL